MGEGDYRCQDDHPSVRQAKRKGVGFVGCLPGGPLGIRKKVVPTPAPRPFQNTTVFGRVKITTGGKSQNLNI